VQLQQGLWALKTTEKNIRVNKHNPHPTQTEVTSIFLITDAKY